MLVVFPLGLVVTAVIFDAIRLGSGNTIFGEVGLWDLSAGLIGATLAAATGAADWTAIPSTSRAKRIGLRHGLLNTAAAVLS
jgi:uncharacterized membrane protein